MEPEKVSGKDGPIKRGLRRGRSGPMESELVRWRPERIRECKQVGNPGPVTQGVAMEKAGIK